MRPETWEMTRTWDFPSPVFFSEGRGFPGTLGSSGQGGFQCYRFIAWISQRVNMHLTLNSPLSLSWCKSGHLCLWSVWSSTPSFTCLSLNNAAAGLELRARAGQCLAASEGHCLSLTVLVSFIFTFYSCWQWLSLQPYSNGVVSLLPVFFFIYLYRFLNDVFTQAYQSFYYIQSLVPYSAPCPHPCMFPFHPKQPPLF